MYQAAKDSRLTSGWGQGITSADAELSTSIRLLRSRSRALIRDAAYAKRAKVIVVNNIIGSGIGMQAQVKTSRDELNDRVNDDIETIWAKWTEATNCHTGGTLHFADIERVAMGQVFDAGEVFIRKHYRPFGYSGIPFALEVIESERVIDDIQPIALQMNMRVRLGVESDRFYRPMAYWIRVLHPGELRVLPGETDDLERVPAEQIIHLHMVDRWPQTRGEPWLHTVIRKLNDMDGYSEAEVVAARGAANYLATIETTNPYGEENAETGQREFILEPGTTERLGIGEKLNFIAPNRPNTQIDPFMRLMLREVAAGVGVSYESLSRDYSQSNYSSSRLALLDDRDLWRMLQAWYVRNFRNQIHREWLQAAIFSKAIKTISVEQFANDLEKFMAVRFKPRGWSWIDPTKEVEAYKEAIKAGFTTTAEVITLTGGGKDLEDVLDDREHELQMMKEKNLKFDTDPSQLDSEIEKQKSKLAQEKQPKQPEPMGGDGDETQGRKAVSIIHHRTVWD